MEAIIAKAQVCRLAMADAEGPCLVPLCFGYRKATVYMHSGPHGRKLDIVGKNPKVCVEFEADVHVQPGAGPCDWSMRFRSVIGAGLVRFVEDRPSKIAALDSIVEHYGGKPSPYPEQILRKTVVLALDLETMTGKKGAG